MPMGPPADTPRMYVSRPRVSLTQLQMVTTANIAFEDVGIRDSACVRKAEEKRKKIKKPILRIRFCSHLRTV